MFVLPANFLIFVVLKQNDYGEQLFGRIERKPTGGGALQ